MTVCDQDTSLQRAYDMAQAKLEAAGGTDLGTDHPARIAWIREMRRLERAGFDFPKPGLTIVAAFAKEPHNRLQAMRRNIYYRNP